MSPRSRTPRKVATPPIIKGFKPYGGGLKDKSLDAVHLLMEEYEAVRLCDYDHFNHQKAAALMGVSRPTFTRIYASALEKIATSFVQGRGMIIEGGHVYFDSEWCTCMVCECKFSNPDNKEAHIRCPLCGSADISSIQEGLSAKNKIVLRCDHCDITEEVYASESHTIQRCHICHASMTFNAHENCGLNK